jgi:hypothetical protein
VTASSSAVGGTGVNNAGAASATTTATGVYGTFIASSSTGLSTGFASENGVKTVAATASGIVDGTSTATTAASISAASLPTFNSTGQAVSVINGAPNAAATLALINANSNIKTLFNIGSAEYFAVAELGGGYSSGGTLSQTTTSSFTETVDMTKLTTRGNLLVGLYGGFVGTGSGVTAVTFTLSVDGVTQISKTFSSAAAAQAYFGDTNNTTSNGGTALNIGSLISGSSLVGTNPTLTISASLSVTSNAANSSFYGGLIIGDPPAQQKPALPVNSAPTITHAPVSSQAFVQAMAGLGAGEATHAVLASAGSFGASPVLAVNRLAHAA